MKALIVKKPLDVYVDEIENPSIEKPSDVIIKVEGCGVCGTDFHLYKGLEFAKYPVIPGHESVGKVIKLGEFAARFLKEGQRVVLDPNLPCYVCEACRKGDIHLCANPVNMGVNLDGAFAEYVKVNYKQCYAISDSVPTEIAALAEPLSCILHGLEIAAIQPWEDALVLGGGPIGLMFFKVMKEVFGIKSVEVVEIDETRMKLANDIGIHEIYKTPSKSKYDVVIEATGTQEAFQLGISVLRAKGRIIQFGVPPENAHGQVPLYEVYKKELKILGSFTNPYTMSRAVKILEKRGEIFKGIVTKNINLEELANLFRKPSKNELKIMVRF